MLMPATLSFTLKQARRLALAAQGFNGRQSPATIKPVHVNRLIERLGLLQIDSVNAVVRSHYLPLFSRLGNYSSESCWTRLPGVRADSANCSNTGAMRPRCCPCRCTR
jgi:uncharacterized protein YcaQ